jgi:hypothetical protein
MGRIIMDGRNALGAKYAAILESDIIAPIAKREENNVAVTANRMLRRNRIVNGMLLPLVILQPMVEIQELGSLPLEIQKRMVMNRKRKISMSIG